MSMEEWVPPQARASCTLPPERLQTLIDLSRDGALESIGEVLDETEKTWLKQAMHGAHDSWASAADPLGDEDLVHLMKAVAVAEMKLPGCTVGDQSPVIALNRVLKRRGGRLATTDLQWLRRHSSNRFLPNGPVL